MPHPHVLLSRVLPYVHIRKVLRRLSLFLPDCLRFGCSLPVASNHHYTQEGPNNRGAQENEDNRYADSPDTRREEVLERVARIDKWL